VIAALWLSTALAVPIQADLHVDTPTQLHRKGLGLDAPEGLEAGLAQLQAGGTNLAVEVLWPPRNADWRAHTFQLLDRLEAEDARLDAIELARSPAQAQAIADSGRVAYIVSLEGAHGLGDGDWQATLDELHSRGLAVLGLTWSMSNSFAGSSGDSSGDQGAGLTESGRTLVAYAQAKGIVIDLSHASRATTLAVCGDSTAPVIASHSNAYAIRAVARNLTDDEIRCIAATGGVIGLNFHASFVGGTRDIKAVADHADHLAAVGGFGVVALGSDFDGLITTPKGLSDASQLPSLWAELRSRGWTEPQLQGLRGGNFLRAWTAAQALATP
jgi:membrane dipeptidase